MAVSEYAFAGRHKRIRKLKMIDIPKSQEKESLKTADWELDFYSRPILESDGKRRWELLISSTQDFSGSKTFSDSLSAFSASTVPFAKTYPHIIPLSIFIRLCIILKHHRQKGF